MAHPRFVSSLVALAVIAGACGSNVSGDSEAVVTNAPQATSTSRASATAPRPPDALAATVEDWAIDNDVVGAVVLVVDGDGDRNVFAHGWSDREAATPSDESHQFRIGSITKLYTAALTMALVEDGILDLDGLASRYMSDVTDPFIVADLLSHTSGLRDVDVAEGIFDAIESGGTIDPSRDPLGDALDQGLAFQPGTRQSYSSIGYLVLESVIEAATGDTFAEVLADRILEPEGLTSTELETAATELPIAYERLGPGSPAISVSQFPLAGLARGAGAAGAIVATADDVARFVRSLFAGSIVTEASLAAMMDISPPRRDYGLGLSAYRAGGYVLYGHNGRTIGFASSVRHDPATNITVVVLSNDGFAPTDDFADSLTVAAIEASAAD